jgi:hypothetical protein
MKIEIKSLGVKSMFKTTLYFASVPLGLMFVIGIFSLIIGVVFGNTELVVSVVPFIVMPFIMIFIYGLAGMLIGVIYNFFAHKFGGLELTVKAEDQIEQLKINQKE